MPRISERQKQGRLERIALLLQRHPDGLTEQEIAQTLNFERRTTNNYLWELTAQGRIYKDGQLWLPLPYQRLVLRPFDLQPEEAMVLYLAARLFVKQSDKRNEAAEQVLLKLADILTSDVGLERDLFEAARELSQRPKQPGYEDVFRTMMQAYIYRRKVKLIYHPYRGEPFDTVFSPYLMEPSAIGFATYAIGHSSQVNALRTYKIERIEHAQLTREEYEIPADFPGIQLLRSAWSIFYGEELTQVALRFSPDVIRRVQETNWHPSQRLEWDKERPGHLLLIVDVASTTDLIPWIRGWGASCEVLEPPSLRKTLYREVRQMAMHYGIRSPKIQTPMEALWAKARRTTGETHLLVYHLIDVAQVALALWEQVLSESMRQQIASLLHLDESSTGRLIAFWIGLHDLGKASPAFQRKYEPAIALLETAGLTFPTPEPKSAPHGLISAWALTSLLAKKTHLDGHLAKRVAHALGGHHGAWPTAHQMMAGVRSADRGDESWDKAREELVQALQATVNPPHDVAVQLSATEENTLLTLLSGLASTADWIGSMETYFEFEDELLDLQEYASRAAAKARQALQQTGWLSWKGASQMFSFETLFPNLPEPNAVQRAVIEAAEHVDAPMLAILEAPTGIGKTEAALYLADRLLHSSRGRGMYVAMPTQATSNQMFRRVCDFLSGRYPQQLVNVQLLHGQAQWIEDFQHIQLAAVYEEGDDSAQGRVAVLSWFLPRKRGLLAPFAVGTVDQALVSILLTKHFFVRLFGLSHKVVIFDEVHAYDTYMETLFHRLLRWLRQIGASVIILSATLPVRAKAELLEAYTGGTVEIPGESTYPALTTTAGGAVRVVPLPGTAERIINIEWVSRDAQAIAERLALELADGGCAVVICNTVGRAQEVYRAIQAAGIVPPDDLLLFHARFPFVWRQRIEEDIVGRFGKEGHRPNKTILVATQVVEQSLDLDFDLMVTDLAPVDLILQRAGRLHRHPHHWRPERLASPRLLLAEPDTERGIPTFGSDAYVYDRYVLLASFLALQGRSQLFLPADTTGLIEAVYGEPGPGAETPQALRAELETAYREMVQARRHDVQQANQRIVLPPDSENLLTQYNPVLEEDNPELHQAFQAMTRLIGPSVSLVCLFNTPRGLAFDPEGQETIKLESAPTADQARRLLQNAVTLQHAGVVFALLAQEPPSAWRAHPALRHHRVAIFERGRCRLERTPYVLLLDRQIGLQVRKEEA